MALEWLLNAATVTAVTAAPPPAVTDFHMINQNGNGGNGGNVKNQNGVELNEMGFPRPMTPGEVAHARRCFEALQRDHGRALLEAGWDRAAVFGGLDPEGLEVVDDLPGVLAALMAGDVLEGITPWRLHFRDRAGGRTAWRRGGGWIGGVVLDEVEVEEMTERAGLLMDSGMSQDDADRVARRIIIGDE